MKGGVLWQLAASFAALSLVAIGGANAVVPDIHRDVVGVLHWMDDATFANLFAIAQITPGPNILIVSIIGWHVAGLAGLVVATLAILVPSCLLAFGIGRVVTRYDEIRWIRSLKEALVPLAIGLILASGVVTARAADRTILAAAITAATALFILQTRKNPLWALASGAFVSIVALRLGWAI